MPKTEVIHWNPPMTVGKTRCGRLLNKIKRWTLDQHDATCNSCIRLSLNDGAAGG